MMGDTWNKARRWLWPALKAIVVISLIAGVVYWVRFAPVQVVSHTVENGTIIAEVMGTGTLEARVEATISPKIAGRVTKLYFDQGDRVSAGDQLVRLDDEELKQQVAIAEANVEAAKAAIVRLNTDKKRSAAVYDQAKKSHDRTQALVSRNAVSREEADKATEALVVAESGVSRAEAAIAEGQRELVAAEKTLEYHRARLKDTEIHAPFDGLIVNRRREPGDVVVPGSSILTLISTEELWISAWVDETEMARLETDQTARAIFRSQPDESFPGTVARLGREADRETREFIVDVRVLELPKNWAVGQRAEVFIKTDEVRDVLTIPAKLVIKKEGENGVFINSDGRTSWRAITVGLRSRDSVEVRDGLVAGDVVVSPVNQNVTLREGQQVAIR